MAASLPADILTYKGQFCATVLSVSTYLLTVTGFVNIIKTKANT